MPKKPKQETMRAAVYYNNQDIRIEERPVPKTGDDEILVRIESSGICGSDVMEWYRLAKAPLVLGHEIAGTVAKAGKRVKRFREGDRVTVAHHVPCNACRYCLAGQHSLCDTLRSTNFDPGGFCEYVRVPAINVDRGAFVDPRRDLVRRGNVHRAARMRSARPSRRAVQAGLERPRSRERDIGASLRQGARRARSGRDRLDRHRQLAARRGETLRRRRHPRGEGRDSAEARFSERRPALRSRRHERGRGERRRAGVSLRRSRRNGAPLRAARAGNDRAASARGDLARPDRDRRDLRRPSRRHRAGDRDPPRAPRRGQRHDHAPASPRGDGPRLPSRRRREEIDQGDRQTAGIASPGADTGLFARMKEQHVARLEYRQDH